MRHLWFSRKGDVLRNRLTVGICAPVVIAPGDVDYPVDGVMSKCHVEFEGLGEHSFDVFGMDSMQAIYVASNIETVIERLSETFVFFWATGEPYLDDE